MEQAKAQFVEKLYIEHTPALYRTCLNRLNHRHEYDTVIEESVQDTFVQCYLSYEKLLDHPCIEGWLHKTCWYKLSKHQKKHDRHRGKQIPLEQFESFFFEQSNQQNTRNDEVALAEDTDVIQRADPVFNYAGVSMGSTGTAMFEAGTSIKITTFKVTSVYLMKLDGSTWVYHSSLTAPTATGGSG